MPPRSEQYAAILETAARIASQDSISEVEDYERSLSSNSRKQVRFDWFPNVSETISRKDYSEKELKRSYYTNEDLQKMEQRRTKILLRMEASKSPRSNMTYRGLEYLTTRGERKLDISIARCVDAVLNEQDRQWNEGIDDFERLALVSQQVTLLCADEALRIAVQDEVDARIAWEQVSGIVSDDEKSTVSRRRSSSKRRTSKGYKPNKREGLRRSSSAKSMSSPSQSKSSKSLSSSSRSTSSSSKSSSRSKKQTLIFDIEKESPVLKPKSCPDLGAAVLQDKTRKEPSTNYRRRSSNKIRKEVLSKLSKSFLL